MKKTDAETFQHLPSLNALRVFYSAARHGSFKRAAAELFVTPSAVSRQVQALEQELGVPLFRRVHRGLELTAEGERFHADVTDALSRLDRASAALRSSRAVVPLRLSVLPSFAGHWLVPRIPRFEAAHPEIEIGMEATTRHADLRRDGIDAAIRFGDGRWPGLRAEPLLELSSFPVCSPALLRGSHPLREPADLRHHAWLEESHVRGAWQAWLRAAGVPSLRPRRHVRYDSAQLVLDAAAAGQGVAILVDLLADADLASGRLVRPFAVTAPSPWTYWLVTRPEDEGERHVEAFRAWLHDEMAAWRRGPAKQGARTRAPTSRKRAKGSFDGRPRRA